MKTKLTAFLMMGALLTLFACCTGQKNSDDVDDEHAEVHVPIPVSYHKVEYCFLKKGKELPADSKIDTQEQFDDLFGVAAVMGHSKRFTPVDFDNYFVIAVALPPTSQDVEIEDQRLMDNGQTLTFEYSVDRDDEYRTYVTQPLLLIAVNRRHERENVVICEVDD
jgi:hypothetical protein